MKKILIVEDDEKISKALGYALGEEGYESVFAADGLSGLKKVGEEKPDIVLLDIMLPKMNGIEVCRTLKSGENHKATPVIMMTALGDTESIVKGLSAGANDYVSKPFNFSELLARVKSHLKMKELYDLVKSEEEEKSALLDVSQSLSSTMDPHETLHTIVTKISEVIDVKRCSIIYVNPRNKKGYVMASHDSRKVKRLEIDLSKYPEIEQIIQTGKPVIINDVYNDPILFSVRDVLNLVDIKSIMGFPVVFKDTLIGTLILRTSRRETPFNEREVRFCSLISLLAASPLKNAYLFEILHQEKEKEREGRVAAEETSRASREMLESIIEASPAPICVFDKKGNITDANTAYTREFHPGSKHEEVIGINLLKNPENQDYLEFYKRILNEEKTRFELSFQSKGDGEKKTSVFYGAPFYDSQRTLSGGMFTINDITDIKKNEELVKSKNEQLVILNKDLETAREKAEEANRLKTEFLANVSHELRTPLTSINGFSKLISQHKTAQDEVREFSQIIHKQGAKLLAMINSLLDLSKIEIGAMKFKFSSLDINQILSEAIQSRKGEIDEKKHSIATDFQEKLPELRLDWDQAMKVFINLIDNAIKFTPEEGEINIKTQLKDDWVEVMVKDNGAGIARDDQQKIFDRLRQLDGSTTREHSGLGLGLDLAKKLVEKMDGTIKVESEPGEGTAFFVSFPVKSSARQG